MLLTRSPSLIFAFIFSIFSIVLTVLTFNIGSNHPKYHIQFLIIFPPLNCIFLFLFSLTWTERRFRLSYIPFICLIILLLSSITLTTISTLFLSSSIIFYLNLLFYFFFTILFFVLFLIFLVLYLYGSVCIHRYCNMMTIEEQNNQSIKVNDIFPIDKVILKSNENELILYMSKLPGRRIHQDVRNIIDDLNLINVDAILTLNETKEFALMNMSNNNFYDLDLYSMHVKRANIEHIIYPIRNHFIPKSISDYMQFLYSIIINVNRSNRNRLLVHCMDGNGRTGMTIVCLELLYDYIMNRNEQEKEQKFIERFIHYPLVGEHSCRVCQSIGNVRKARSRSIYNPLQILFVHEFYARLKSPPYMQQIKRIINLNEKLLLSNFEDFRIRTNI